MLTGSASGVRIVGASVVAGMVGSTVEAVVSKIWGAVVVVVSLVVVACRAVVGLVGGVVAVGRIGGNWMVVSTI